MFRSFWRRVRSSAESSLLYKRENEVGHVPSKAASAPFIVE